MKTFHRKSLPSKIVFQGATYVEALEYTNMSKNLNLPALEKRLKEDNLNMVIVYVHLKSYKNKKNNHDEIIKPQRFVFVNGLTGRSS
jgi:hypothetical protein